MIIDNWQNIGFIPGNGNSNSPKDYSFADKNVKPGKYKYRLKQIDLDGSISYSSVIETDFKSTPTKFFVSQNYPNPFNLATTIDYTIPVTSNVRIEVYDLLGSKVAELANEMKEAGYYSVNFNATTLPSGVYLYSVEAGTGKSVNKMLLSK